MASRTHAQLCQCLLCQLCVAELAIAALIRCDSVVKKLLERARDGSSSSRLFIQLQVSGRAKWAVSKRDLCHAQRGLSRFGQAKPLSPLCLCVAPGDPPDRQCLHPDPAHPQGRHRHGRRRLYAHSPLLHVPSFTRASTCACSDHQPFGPMRLTPLLPLFPLQASGRPRCPVRRSCAA